MPKQALINPADLDTLPRRLLTYTDIAEWSGLSISYLRGQVAEGKLKCRYFAPQVARFRPAAVAEWFEKVTSSRGEAKAATPTKEKSASEQ